LSEAPATCASQAKSAAAARKSPAETDCEVGAAGKTTGGREEPAL
jgi:hypothetical protein